MIDWLKAIAFMAVCGFLSLILWDLHRESPLIHAALYNVASASYDLKQNSGLELQETRKTTAAAKEFFDRTQWALDGRPGHPGLIPQATILVVKAQPAVDNLNAGIVRLNLAAEHLDKLITTGTATMAELQGAVGAFHQSITDLDSVITDPKIRIALDNLAGITADLDASIKQLDEMLKSATATAQDVQAVADKVREQYTKAKNLYYAIFKELLSIGSEGIQFVLKK